MRFFKAICIATGLMCAGMAQAGQIIVTGVGVVEQAPDMATVSVGVRHQAPTAKVAMDSVSKATAAILGRMADLGVAERDIQTRDLSLHPVWDRNAASNGESRVIGYMASNQVEVRVRDLDALGNILDDVVGKGANQFSGLRFSVQNPEPALNEARKRAVQDARAKADLFAAAAGVNLGALLSLSEASASRPEPVFAEMAAMRSDAGVPVASGEITTSAQVTLVFETTED